MTCVCDQAEGSVRCGGVISHRYRGPTARDVKCTVSSPSLRRGATKRIRVKGHRQEGLNKK